MNSETEPGVGSSYHFMESVHPPEIFSGDLMAQLTRCVSCGKCMAGCPVYQLTRREETSARAKLNVLKWYLASGGKPSPASAMMFFNCSQCLRCQDVCPAELPLRELFLAARRNLAGGGVETPAPWRWKNARKLWPLSTRRKEPGNGAASPARTTAAAARPPVARETGPTGVALLLASPLLHAAAPGALAMTRKVLRAAGCEHQVRFLRGPSWHHLYWRGELGTVEASLAAATSGLPTGTPLLFAEPELGEICRSAWGSPASGPGSRRLVDLTEVLSAVAWNPPRETRPFTILPPPFPLDVAGLEHWNSRWSELRLPGWTAFPDRWRAFRAEGLRAYYPATARHLAGALLDAAAAEGVRELVAPSVRSLFWLQTGAPRTGRPVVTSLPRFLSRFLPE